MRKLKYAQAISEAHDQLLASDPSVMVIGQGLWSPWYAGQSISELDKKYGKNRIIDTPVSENAVTAAAIGAAMSGMKPILFHPRMDFMLLATDALVNQAANWSYLFSGQVNVPLTIRAAINRGGEQGAQHSQALHAFFFHTPGIKVVMPATARDAKGLLIAAVNDGNPVMYIDDRWCYDHEEDVPEEMYAAELGKAAILREGQDLTIVGIGHLSLKALEAADLLAMEGINAEVIDLRTIKPWDVDTVCKSVEKTGHLVVADSAWLNGSVSGEIVSTVVVKNWDKGLKSAPVRVGLPNTPAPVASNLEKIYYPDEKTIFKAGRIATGKESMNTPHKPSMNIPGMIVG
jgi:acetoin:2,6-dichlorophenolindophenol oxidoreductase subunit beta